MVENNESDQLLIPIELMPKMKVHKLILPSNPSPSNSYQYFNFENCYRDLSYHKHPPPTFEYFLRDVLNFEAMIYYTLNSSNIFFGETIAILIPKNKEVYIYIFRRILLHFILENNFVVSIDFEITSTFLNFPQSIVKIIVKPFPHLKINEKCQEIKTLPKILMKGFEFYEKSENENALAICGTPKYLQVLEKAGLKSLLKPIYSDIVPAIVPTKKKVVNEIKDNGIRISIMAQISAKKFNIIFKHPDNEEFIPLYISFLREIAIIGKQAIKDYKTHPKFVVFDILQVAGKSLMNPPKINEHWGFNLSPIDDSSNAKLGIKIHTFNGIKLFPVKIIFAILFKYLLKNVGGSHFLSKEFTLRFLQKKLLPSEKSVFWEVSKILNLSMILNCEN